jgi:pyruvate,water dikinase
MLFTQLAKRWARIFAPESLIRAKYEDFKELLRADASALDLIADLEAHLYGHDPADAARVRWLASELIRTVERMADSLGRMNADHADVAAVVARISTDIAARLVPQRIGVDPPYIISLDQAAAHPAWVGGKAANLSRARAAGAPTPPGFVITAAAFGLFVRENDLEREIERRFTSVRLSDHDAIVRVTGELQELILEGEIPAVAAEAMTAATAELVEPGQLLAVRSSALAEDGRISFAGQYASELHVEPDDILAAYKRVLAGKYCPRAVSYRIRHGLSDADTAMAVLVLPMVEAASAGVVYTCDPACPAVGGEAMGVYVVDGLAANLVDGSATPGKYYLTREDSPRLLQGCACEGHTLFPESALRELGQWAMRLERTFGEPQDVEWTYGPRGLCIVQTRRLHQEKDPHPRIAEDGADFEVLVSGLDCASPGAACGPVHHAPQGSDFRSIPKGSMVVTPTLRPALSQFLDRIAAVIAASGSRASHFASVARERGVPVVVGCSGAELLAGQVVTVDAVSGRIFAGCVSGVLERTQAAQAARTVVRGEHAEVAHLTVHLGLTDPDSSDFTSSGCRSLHDVVRFCHEKSVREMFSLVQRGGRGMGRSRRLVTDLPLVMYILDLGGGLAPHAPRSGPVGPTDLFSRPMLALWSGLADPAIAWDRSQRHVDWEEFDRISGGIFQLDSRLLASYALVSDDYVHLNIRFGYHFSIVDSVCAEHPGANYVNFRFKGGGAGLAQRLHRLEFMTQVLTHAGFEISTRGDMLDASLHRLPRSETERGLRCLGLVLAGTRLMDMRLTSVEQAREEADAFVRLCQPEDA